MRPTRRRLDAEWSQVFARWLSRTGMGCPLQPTKASYRQDGISEELPAKIGAVRRADSGLGAPLQVTDAGSGWFLARAFGAPNPSQKVEIAKSFLQWAASKEYVAPVGESEGWVSAPPGTRKSTYENPSHIDAAPLAEVVNNSVVNAAITKSTKGPVPYVGIQYVAIPEFQGIGTQVGQSIAAAPSGQMSVDEALEAALAATERTMKQADYMK